MPFGQVLSSPPGDRLWRATARAAEAVGDDRRCPYKPRRHSSVAGNLGERRLLSATFAQSRKSHYLRSEPQNPDRRQRRHKAPKNRDTRNGSPSPSRAAAKRTRAAAVSADMVSPE